MRYPFSVVVQIPNGMCAHISILRLSILESVLTATSAAFVCQAANVGQLMLCGIHSACPVLSGGGKCWQTIAVRPLLPFRALFGKEKPGQCPPKKLGMYRACLLILGPVCRGHSLPKKSDGRWRNNAQRFGHKPTIVGQTGA